jgi:hypothetical protein
MLIAVDFLLNQPMEIVIAPPAAEAAPAETASALRIVREAFLPNKIVAATSAMPPTRRSDTPGDAGRYTMGNLETLIPLVQEKPAVGNSITVYICQNYVCQTPVSGLDAIREAMRKYSVSGTN